MDRLFYVVAAVAVSAVWVPILVGRSRHWERPTIIRYLVLWPIGLLGVAQSLLSPRAVQIDYAGVIGLSSDLAIRATQGLMVVIFIGSLLSFTSPRPTGRPMRLLMVGFLTMTAGIAGAALFSRVPGIPIGMAIAVVALFAIIRSGTPAHQAVTTLRHITRVYIYGSLLALVLNPSWSLFPNPDRELFGIGRLTGFSLQPNALGAVAALALLCEVTAHPRQKWRRLHIGAAGVVLILAQSRTAWFAALAGLLVLTGPTLSRAARWVVGLGIAGVIVYHVLNPGWVVSLKAAILGDIGLATLNGRTEAWQIALEVWHRWPLFGYGHSVFGTTYRREFLPDSLQWMGSAHNQGIQGLAQLGLIGTFALAAYVVILLIVAVKTRRVTMGLGLAVLVVMLVRSVTEVPFDVRMDSSLLIHAAMLLLVTAVPVRAIIQKRESEGEELQRIG